MTNTYNPYVVIKLVTGETLMGTITEEFDESVVVIFPIALKSMPLMRNGTILEQTITAEYCPFSEDKEFNFYRKDLVFVKPMKRSVAAMYQKVLEEIYLNPFKESTEVSDESSVESIVEDHEESRPKEESSKNKILH